MTCQKDPATLARLAALAAIKREAELAKLALIGQSRMRLMAGLSALRQTESALDPDEAVSDPAMVRARLAHRRWAEGQQRALNQKLALVTADWLRQKPSATRAFGRASVLSTLQHAARREQKGQP